MSDEDRGQIVLVATKTETHSAIVAEDLLKIDSSTLYDFEHSFQQLW